jgi:hypothetical protein
MFSYANNDAEKVFGIGLSRTGTTSLSAALGTLGLRSFHWAFRPEGRILRLEDAYFCDAISDINAAFCFETLARMFPKAKFIYTTRPQDAWERSIIRHYGARTPGELKQRLCETPVTDAPAPAPLKHALLYHAIHHGLYTEHRTWRDAYAAHDRAVRGFFGPSPRLMEFDIFERKEGWNELCRFLGRPLPQAPYPSVSWDANGAA